MTASPTGLFLSAALALAMALALLNYQLWRFERQERSALWLAAWLGAGAVYAFCRLLQFYPASEATYVALPRLTLTSLFISTWFGLEMVSALTAARTPRWLRIPFILLVAAPIVLAWTTRFVLTDTVILERGGWSETFHGVEPGPLFLPAALTVLALSALQPIRLVVAKSAHKTVNLLMAVGFLAVIGFALFDFVASSVGRGWVRLSDFSYLPIGFLFTGLQVRRIGSLYRALDTRVQERTAALRTANERLRLEVRERALAEETARRRAAEMTAVHEATRELVMEVDQGRLLQTVVEHAANLLGTSGGGMFLCEPEARQVRCVVSHRMRRDYRGLRLQYGEGAAGRVAESGEPLIMDDYRLWDGRSPAFEEDRPFASQLSVPVRWHERVIGVIQVLEADRVRSFTQQDILLLELFANQAAGSVQNALLFEAEQAAARQASALADVGRHIGQSLELDVVLERIAAVARDLLGAENSAVYLAKPGTSRLRAVAALGPSAERIKSRPLEFEEGLVGSIAAQRKGEIVNNAVLDPRHTMLAGTKEDPHEHLMGVPVLSGELVSGAIAVWRRGEGREFRAHELNYLERLAGQVAVAIENARLFETTRRRLVEINSVHKVSVALRTAETLDEALPIILDQSIALLNARSAALEMISPASGEIVMLRGHGDWVEMTGKRAPPGSGVSGHVIASGEPFVSADITTSDLPVWPERFGPSRAVACVPIISQEQRIGVLWIGRETPLQQEDVSLLGAIGEMVGTAVDRLRLHDQTQALLRDLRSSRDELAEAYDETITGWSRALDLRDQETEGHTQRLVGMTLRLARAFGMGAEQMMHIRRGALLHDIGKMGISDNLLRKTGPLSTDEWREMQQHPRFAFELLEPITYLRPALEIPYCHHERWDGSGYPRGLKGEQIPLAARIFAVVDVYDAISHDRRYRAAWTKTKALKYIRDHAGRHFDPKVVDVFFELLLDGTLGAEAGEEARPQPALPETERGSKPPK